MGLFFEFGFLGPEHNYVALLTKTGMHSVPLEHHPAETAFFRVPQNFQDNFSRFASRHYIHNIRGHDCYSYAGQSTDREGRQAPLQTSLDAFREIKELQKISIPNKCDLEGNPELIINLGPSSGSFFVDAPRRKLYRWANLSAGLEAALQTLLCRNGYGDPKSKITNVAMNSENGWIVQGGKDNTVLWGGRLPDPLIQVLESLGNKKPRIKTLVLNHQHPNEYVLILDDGKVYCRLHKDFQSQLHDILKRWATGNRLTLGWNFLSSCDCSMDDQKLLDALYYYRRGCSHFQQKSFRLAYKYLKEAHTQNWSNVDIRKAYAQSLIALRHVVKDVILETYLERADPRQPLPGGSDKNAEFRYQYMTMLETIELVKGQIFKLLSPPREWSWVSEVEDLRVKRTRDVEVEDQRDRIDGRVELDLSPVSTTVPENSLPEDVVELPASIPDYISCQYMVSNIRVATMSDGSTSYFTGSKYA